ncbi:hypothetical protein AJ80_03664 [Polytolypa hystricis UAMH7299]|uniref:propanoyl-CoA C-acyltransferase n=1 Tax=Polytolypa hystricis (strain UAMH7299) TaxID=1447883 RepID=A0A2B7YEY7_POLH7|nr:hypothetical protein AJ80_03664 [Polytolypa hystricis UAMH7299]
MDEMGQKKRGRRVFVIGVGMTRFTKPAKEMDYPQLGLESGAKALLDAGISYDQVEAGFACYAYGDSTCGQRVFYQFGMTGIPIVNVNNACATGSSGLYLARESIRLGGSDVALVIGFEKMYSGSLKKFFLDRANPQQFFGEKLLQLRPESKPGAPCLFTNGAMEYIEKFDAQTDDLVEIARLSHLHSSKNPYSQFRTVYSKDEIKNSARVYGPTTKLQCCPTSDGSGAAILVSEDYLNKHPHLLPKAVEIAGQVLMTDQPTTFGNSSIDLVGFNMTQRAVHAALKQANASIKDVKVCELHDCFAANVLITIDALGLCEHGKAGKFIRDGNITYGGRVVVNPSGGLISKGHPLGATGLAQCAELVWQLRGWANNRLVTNAPIALQHNLGLGGAAVVSVYRRADGGENQAVRSEVASAQSGLGYNPAVEWQPLTAQQLNRASSRKNLQPFARVGVQAKQNPAVQHGVNL